MGRRMEYGDVPVEAEASAKEGRYSCRPAREAGRAASGRSVHLGRSSGITVFDVFLRPLRSYGGRNSAAPCSRRTIAVFCFLWLWIVFPAIPADWPNWGGPNRNRVSGEADLSFTWSDAGPKVLWKANVGTGFSSMSIGAGRLFTMGNEEDTETVHCLNAEQGTSLWTYSYDCPLDPNLFEGGPTSTPTVDGKHVYTISRQGQIHCLMVKDGKPLWSRDLAEEGEMPAPGWGYAGSPVVHGKQLLLNVGESGMALDKLTGETIWQSQPEEAGYSTPVLFREEKKHLAVFSSGKYFSAVDLESGEIVWSHRWLTRYGMNACDPIVNGDRVFITGGYGKGAALLKHAAEEPEELWKVKTLRSQLATPVMIGEYLYGIDGDENSREPALKCLEFATGKEVWSHAEVGFGSLIAAGGKLIVLAADGRLIVGEADAKKWSELARANVLEGKCWTPPALADGRLYCRSAFGELVCLDMRVK